MQRSQLALASISVFLVSSGLPFPIQMTAENRKDMEKVRALKEKIEYGIWQH